MKFTNLVILTLSVGIAARADFSYTLTQKSSGASDNGQAIKQYLKGQKMLVDTGSTVMMLDFDAQTITSINRSQKTYSVKSFSDLSQSMPQNMDIQADVKETGQKKNVNGFDASEVVITMQVDSPQTQKAGMKMQMEMDMWISKDVPGGAELHAFYQRNMDRFPWAAMGRGGNASMQQAMANLQKKMATMNGVPVSETIRVKPMGGGGAPGMTPQQQQQMEQAKARLQAMQQQGGPAAAGAAQALARMNGMSGGSGSLFETTMDSSNFSISPIPDSIFAIPADYQKSEK